MTQTRLRPIPRQTVPTPDNVAVRQPPPPRPFDGLRDAVSFFVALGISALGVIGAVMLLGLLLDRGLEWLGLLS